MRLAPTLSFGWLLFHASLCCRVAIASVWKPEPPSYPIVYTNSSSPPAHATNPSDFVGVVECPCAKDDQGSPLRGYLRWDDLVRDVNNLTDSGPISDVLTFILCPNNFHDAINTPPLLIMRSNVIIQCGASGEPDGCVVSGAKVKTGDHLVNIQIIGIEFRQQRDELKIGEGTEVTLRRCRFLSTLFPGLSTVRAAVVSFGKLHVIDSFFGGNYGLGAVLVAKFTAQFERTQFCDNMACDEDRGASAIQVGDPVLGTEANVSIVDSCFENNIGKNIVLLSKDSKLSSNRGNAVLNFVGGAVCRGVTMLTDQEDDVFCDSFQYHNTSCYSLFEGGGGGDSSPVSGDAAAPSLAPILTENSTAAPVDATNPSAPSAPKSAPTKPSAPSQPVSVAPLPSDPTVGNSSSVPDGGDHADSNIDDDAIVPLAGNGDTAGDSSSGLRRPVSSMAAFIIAFLSAAIAIYL
jgi:hypothetical protein